MENPKPFFECLMRHLDDDAPVVIATVISRSGSGPREPGAAMLVRPDGKTVGTIGGGILEARVSDLARSVFESAAPQLKTFNLANAQAAVEGMICGGRVEVLIDYVAAQDTEKKKILKTVMQALSAHRSVTLITSIRRQPDGIRTGFGLIRKEGIAAGSVEMADVHSDIFLKYRNGPAALIPIDESLRYFFQPIRPEAPIFILGAGHIGAALAPICRFLGFHTVIIDDRAEFANRSRFPDADDIRCIDTFTDCFKQGEIDPNSHIVIVTRGHLHDQTVLSQALKTDAGYIGMIGSRKKRDITYAALRGTGFSEKDLHRVHCPIGLDIGANTPAEIAVSIASEIIRIRSGQDGSKRRR
jgi:xanthine dehydrogenase accessory factor